MAGDRNNILKVAFIGAGAIHFGGSEGPWDHSARLENMDGVQFVAIVDPDKPTAEEVLQRKLSGSKANLYKSCKLYGDISELLDDQKPDIILLGIPPAYRGSSQKGKDLELQVVSRGIHLFVEKPMSVVLPEEFTAYSDRVEDARLKSDAVISVGYMFRYHAAVLKMKEIMASHGGKVMLFNARYYAAYSQMDHAYWWDINKSGGPVVEQATHFYDVARFLVGDIKQDSVDSLYLRDSDPGGAGKLSRVAKHCEENVPVDKRVPRVHIATWRFQAGGLGTLSHVVALHGKQYETSIEIVMDGLRMTLYEPYTKKCKLLVRDGRTGSDEEVTYHFGDADPYKGELETFINAVRSKSASSVASTYQDAAKTYSFTWDIRLAGEAKTK